MVQEKLQTSAVRVTAQAIVNVRFVTAKNKFVVPFAAVRDFCVVLIVTVSIPKIAIIATMKVI
jgi:hypothetical protein